MPRKYEIGDIVSGSNLSENFKGRTLTAIGFARGSEVPQCVLRSHESTSPTLISRHGRRSDGFPGGFAFRHHRLTRGASEVWQPLG